MNHIYRSFPLVVLVIMSIVCTSRAQAEQEVENNRSLGVMISQSNDGTQVGFVKLTEVYEVNFTLDGVYEKKGGASTPDGETYNLGITGRGGYRTTLGEGNYMVVGIEGHSGILQRNDGFKRDPQTFIGPYFGIQRHFPKSNFVLLGWICPYSYVVNTMVDNTGVKSKDSQHQFFEVGGIGFAYLL